MLKRIIFVFSFLIFCFAGNVLAADTNTAPPVNAPAGEVFTDYYRFGSIGIEIQPKNASYLPGEAVQFQGKITNDNTYPMINGQLYVRISQENTTNTFQNGDFIVDEFFAIENISLKAGETKDVKFEWQIPQTAMIGKYKLMTFFTVDKKYNLSGLSFTSNIFGSFCSFQIAGENNSTVFFDRNNVKFNDKPYLFRAFIPKLTTKDKANIIIPVKNTYSEAKEIKITYDLYWWDGLLQKNKLKTTEETITVPANSQKNVTYNLGNFTRSVYYLNITAQSGTDKSIIPIRFGISGVAEARINMIGANKFPLIANEQAKAFATFQSASYDDFEGKIDLLLKDLKGKVLANKSFSGIILGNVQVMTLDIPTSNNLYSFTVESNLYDKNGKIIDTGSVTYNNEPLKEEKIKPSSNRILQICIAVLIVILLAAIVFMAIKMKKKKAMLPIFIFLAFAGGALLFGFSPLQIPSLVWAEGGGGGGGGGSYVPPTCDPSCGAGGTCTSTNICTCKSGYTGATCTPTCDPSCGAHGTCTAPNVCSCQAGYSGSTCTGINFNQTIGPYYLGYLYRVAGSKPGGLSAFLTVNYDLSLKQGNRILSDGDSVCAGQKIDLVFNKDGEWSTAFAPCDTPPAHWENSLSDLGCLGQDIAIRSEHPPYYYAPLVIKNPSTSLTGTSGINCSGKSCTVGNGTTGSPISITGNVSGTSFLQTVNESNGYYCWDASRPNPQGIANQTSPYTGSIKPVSKTWNLKTCVPPKGSLDSVSCDSLSGWTCDLSNPSQPLQVDFYKDGPMGTGTLIGSTTANVAGGQEVSDQCGGNANHAFSFETPLSIKDGKGHTIYAYGIGTPVGNNFQLNSTPKNITCAPPPPNPIVTTPYLKEPDWCSSAFQYILNWRVNTLQSAKQIQVSTSPTFNSDIASVYDSGKITNNNVQLYTLSSSSYPDSNPKYNSTYYWRVRFWNSIDAVSSWSAAQTINTPKHAYPDPLFTKSPSNPKVGQSIQFTDTSTAYNSSIQNWSWTFQDGTPSSSTLQNPSIVFNTSGRKDISLKITDSDGYSCSVSGTSGTSGSGGHNYIWTEVAPK